MRVTRSVLVLAVFLWGCAGSAVKEPAFPQQVPPNWTRAAVSLIEPTGFSVLLQSAGIKQGWKTEYRAADGALARVQAFAIRSNTQGLDLVQRWKPERDNAQFYTDHYLLNVAWENAKHDELASLVRSLPKLVEEH